MPSFCEFNAGSTFYLAGMLHARLLQEIDGYNAVSLETGVLSKLPPTQRIDEKRVHRKLAKATPVKSLATFNSILGHAILHSQIEVNVSIDPKGTAIYWDAREGWRMIGLSSYQEPSQAPMLPWRKPTAVPFAIVKADGSVTPGEAFENLI